MDFNGNIRDMPKGMQEALDRKDWVTLQSKKVKPKDSGSVCDTESILIVLSHYKKLPDESTGLLRTITRRGPENEIIPKHKIPTNHNPFPDIGSILIDIEAKDEILCQQFKSRNELVIKKKDDKGKALTYIFEKDK